MWFKASKQENSKVKTIFENKWLSLKMMVDPDNHVDGYIYSHETKCNGQIVSVLPFRKTNDGEAEYLLRVEVTPCWSMEPSISSLTGGMEKEMTPEEVALMELREESGYDATEGELIKLGTCRGTKSSDTTYHLFAVDVTNKEAGKRTGDGSYHDTNAEVTWRKKGDFDDCVDPIAYVALYRLQKQS